MSEHSIVRKDYVVSQIKSVVSRIQNVRQIEKIVEEYIGIQLANTKKIYSVL